VTPDDVQGAGGPAARRRSPRVAVVIPCFNDGPLVPEAVGSVAEAEPVEIVVVDDGSTDPATIDTLRRLEENGVSVLHQANTGLAGARMAGVRATDAPYVFNLDADDLAVSGSLATMADRLDAAPDAAVCFGNYSEFGDVELTRLVPERLDGFRVAYANEYPVSALFRRRDLLALGGWRPHAPGYEDWSLWMALAEYDRQAIHAGADVLTFRRRLHGERMLTAAKRRHRALYRALRSSHPQLFANIAARRRQSDMPVHRKLLYPIVYGGRPRFAFERKVKAWLDRVGVWTLRG
jgi:glycosyltransferase involved in cell wall biosynthesis